MGLSTVLLYMYRAEDLLSHVFYINDVILVEFSNAEPTPYFSMDTVSFFMRIFLTRIF